MKESIEKLKEKENKEKAENEINNNLSNKEEYEKLIKSKDEQINWTKYQIHKLKNTVINMKQRNKIFKHKL